MRNEAYSAALDWLNRDCYVTWESVDRQTAIGRRRPELAHKPGLDVLYPVFEVGVTVVSAATIASGIAQAHVNKLRRWKARAPGRWVAIVAPRELSEADLVQIRGVDQVVRWPLDAGARQTDTRCPGPEVR